MNFGEKLFRLRTARGICQKELAAYLHVSISSISNYENGIHSPDLKMIGKIARFFNVSTDYLLGHTEYIPPMEELQKEWIGPYRFCDIMDIMIELSPERSRDLIEYIEMLRLKDDESKDE